MGNNDINLSKTDIENYNYKYGVNIKKVKGELRFSGEQRNVDRVKNIIDRNNFISKHSLASKNNGSGRISDQLESINEEKDYSRIGDNNHSVSNNYSSVIEFSI